MCLLVHCSNAGGATCLRRLGLTAIQCCCQLRRHRVTYSISWQWNVSNSSSPVSTSPRHHQRHRWVLKPWRPPTNRPPLLTTTTSSTARRPHYLLPTAGACASALLTYLLKVQATSSGENRMTSQTATTSFSTKHISCRFFPFRVETFRKHYNLTFFCRRNPRIEGTFVWPKTC